MSEYPKDGEGANQSQNEKKARKQRPTSLTATSEIGGQATAPFQLLEGSPLFATPWDPNNPEERSYEFVRPPLVPPKDSDYTFSPHDDERPLLSRRNSSFGMTPSPRHTKFTANLSGLTLKEGDAIDEFGDAPSANLRTEFVPPPRVRKIVRDKNRRIWLPRSHPWKPNAFEALHWRPLLTLTAIVVISYPVLYLATRVAHERSLFWTRFIVGSASSILGFALGTTMLEIGKRILEAATWATIIHLSMYSGSAITLSELELKSTYHNWTWRGLSMFVERHFASGTRRANRPYDKRPWSIFILCFILISLVSACISFLLGRLIDISTRDDFQWKSYEEISVIGDLTPQDIELARPHYEALTSFTQTWTLNPFGSGREVPQPVLLKWGEDDVYLAEASEEFTSGGNGFGSLQRDSKAELIRGSDGKSQMQSRSIDGAPAVGSIVRYSRWGLRIRCAKIPDARLNIIPRSQTNKTYAYIPRTTITGLITSLGYPESVFTLQVNTSVIIAEGDVIPEAIDLSSVGFIGRWDDNGVAQSFMSKPIDKGAGGGGWLELEVIMLRIRTSSAPNGTFALYSDNNHDTNTIGYDGAVCVEAVEPWVVDTYNSTSGRASSLQIVGKGGLSNQDINYGQRLGSPLDKGLNNTLSSEGKFDGFVLGHENSRNQILKDNGRDFWYVASPTVISWTGETGPKNYTTLSMKDLQVGLGMADASQILPYLVGSQPVLAYRYKDITLASASIFSRATFATLAFILSLGCIATVFVPRLPLGIPRRDFSVFTWLAAFEGDELLNQAVRRGVDRNMDLDEMHNRFGDYQVKYGP
ncbi:hypothetical protein FRC14_001371 [Serendipita sp. 396]|nr:hypothetical protein FRC14_001371 [Serendipita sp. 396]KAG8781297.1 hypothetical protein FRC15_008889 [Serendipita sp. 397]KAG8802293.1 hypothetical protein FRC16_009963 [Serendipita sp. 398]KAG9054848.1 hypothetical protein FS842_003967 [Serendipita sp. 407]